MKTNRMKKTLFLREVLMSIKKAKKNWEANLAKKVKADPFEEKIRLYVSKHRDLVGPFLQMMGSAQPKEIYSPIVTKPSNLDELNYLQEAPRRGSSIQIFLKNKTVRINNIPTQSLVVEMRYNLYQ